MKRGWTSQNISVGTLRWQGLMLSGKFSVLPPSRSKEKSIPLIQKDHSVVLFRRLTSPWEKVWREFLLELLQSPLLAFHSPFIGFPHSLESWTGVQCHTKISAFATRAEAVSTSWAGCNQNRWLWNNFLYKPLHPLPTGKLLIFSPLSPPFSISFSLCSLWSSQFTHSSKYTFLLQCLIWHSLSQLRIFCFQDYSTIVSKTHKGDKQWFSVAT